MKHSIKDSRGCIVDDLKLNMIQVECPTKCSLTLPAVYGQDLVILVMYLQTLPPPHPEFDTSPSPPLVPCRVSVIRLGMVSLGQNPEVK